MEEEESPAASRSNRQNTLSQLNTAEHFDASDSQRIRSIHYMTLGRRWSEMGYVVVYWSVRSNMWGMYGTAHSVG